MAESKTLQRLRENRIERMRLGQGACDIVALASDPETRVALVPLLESEYYKCQIAAAEMPVPENVAGAAAMDREERRAVLSYSIREIDDLSQRIFPSAEDMTGTLEPTDINKLYDRYIEMTAEFSPHIGELSEEELDFLKELFESFQWNAMSGKQFYALSRFLSTLLPEQLTDSLPGSFSINS